MHPADKDCRVLKPSQLILQIQSCDFLHVGMINGTLEHLTHILSSHRRVRGTPESRHKVRAVGESQIHPGMDTNKTCGYIFDSNIKWRQVTIIQMVPSFPWLLTAHLNEHFWVSSLSCDRHARLIYNYYWNFHIV